MTLLLYLLIVVEIVCSLLLIGVILLPETKGQGVGLAFGAGMGESLFGAQMGNVLTKTTIILGIVFLVNTTVISLLQSSREAESAVDAAPVLPAATAPMAPPGPAPGALDMPSELPPEAAMPAPPVDEPVQLGPVAESVAVPAVVPEEPAVAEEAPAPTE